MKPYQLFNKLFSLNNIEETYNQKIAYNSSTGADKISKGIFEKDKQQHFEIINKKVFNQRYKFTRYKKMLILKGENKPPRVISIPTIRDKITLNILNQIFNNTYQGKNISPLPHSVINSLYDSIKNGNYDYYIKIDIKKFYASIDHEILISLLKQKMRKKELISLITKAISNEKLVGIPEGLSISNSLGNIYLLDVDSYYGDRNNIEYFRYVDDIIILCNQENAEKEKDNIIKILAKKHLTINEKFDEGKLNEKCFNYLGYEFKDQTLSVRGSSVNKLETSIEQLFISFITSSERNVELLKWKINLRITGCIKDRKKYGWLLYFSQVNDIATMSHLDWYVSKMKKRFNIGEDIQFKKFKKTYYEIKFNLSKTKYIVNLDTLSCEEKKRILSAIYTHDVKGLKDKEINQLFYYVMAKELNSLERDIQPIS
jgi:Reverse transcriptase (RNA-dependent DNA polymerase).